MSDKSIPKGFHTITPYLAVKQPHQLMQFLQRAFGATVTIPPRDAGDANFHAEIRIGDSMVMLVSTSPGFDESTAYLYLYVPDADALYKQALAAGATAVEEVTDRPWGDRMGSVKDPSGNLWMLATCKENRRPNA